MFKTSIFFADLFHDKNFAANVVPLNIGYLANALKVTFRDSLEIKLFKHSAGFIRALESRRPNIVCLSNYVWNARLSLWAAEYIKRRYPDTMVIMGGPNVRHDRDGLKEFLDKNQAVDAYVPLTGELPLVDLMHKLLDKNCRGPAKTIYESIGSVAGVYLNAPGYSYLPYNPSSFKDSFKFGSPYLNGVLDEFIADDKLVPVFETNRGCPYSCAYCSWGVAALSHVYKKDLDMARSEFDYVVKNGAKQRYWIIADANFGIFPRDLDIARALKTLRDSYDYPLTLNANWAKLSSANLVIEMIKVLSDMISPQIAVQSLDKRVLKEVNRINMGDSNIAKLIEMFHKEKRKVNTDILVGLSSETLQSHKDTLYRAFELGFDQLNLGSIQVLPGSEIDSDLSRKKYGLITKYRRLSGYYGRYSGDFVYEVEESICGSKDLSEQEFFYLRETHFLIYALWSSGIARDLLRLGMRLGISPLDVFDYLKKGSRNASFINILKGLQTEMKEEQFLSAESLDSHIKENHMEEIILGEGLHDKLMWKYFACLLVERSLLNELLEDIMEYLTLYTDAGPSALNVAKQISIDTIKLDFSDSADLIKHEKYAVARKDYEYLVRTGFLPEGQRYEDGILHIQYTYEKDSHVYFKGLMGKFNYKQKPVDAFYQALHYGLILRLNYTIA